MPANTLDTQTEDLELPPSPCLAGLTPGRLAAVGGASATVDAAAERSITRQRGKSMMRRALLRILSAEREGRSPKNAVYWAAVTCGGMLHMHILGMDERKVAAIIIDTGIAVMGEAHRDEIHRAVHDGLQRGRQRPFILRECAQ